MTATTALVASSAALAALVIVAAVSAYRVARPHQGNPLEGDVDAVVVLAGGRGERGRAAMALMDDLVESGHDPVLVVNVGNRDWGPGWEVVAPLCLPGDRAYRVECLTVNPDNTAGEASTISALAQRRGWTTLALVTSHSHLHRATVRFERCFDGTVIPSAATGGPLPPAYVYEWFGTMHALLIDRAC